MKTSLFKPTSQQFQNYQKIFEYFNESLFGNELPNCLLNFSRKKNSHGFFAPQRWESETRSTHEISLNPDTLARDPKAVLATLVHEMCHLWQEEFGKPPRRNYHNQEFAKKMETVGLMCSTTGEPGGDKTGQNMTHYIIDGGVYEVAFYKMPSDFLLPFKAIAFPEAAKKAKTKTKYTCPSCEANVWGKPNMNITCGDCEEPFTESF